MASYSIAATEVSQAFPTLKKGRVRIYSSTDIYYAVGANPIAVAGKCAILRAGETTVITLPVASRLAILQVSVPGTVTVTEVSGGARSSCSA